MNEARPLPVRSQPRVSIYLNNDIDENITYRTNTLCPQRLFKYGKGEKWKMANRKKIQFEIILDDAAGGLQNGDYTVERLTMRIRDSVWSRVDQPAHRMAATASRRTAPPTNEELLIDFGEGTQEPLVDLAITVETGATATQTEEEVFEEFEDVSEEEKSPARRGSRAQELLNAVMAGKRTRRGSERRDNSPKGNPTQATAAGSGAKAPITTFRFPSSTGATEKRRTQEKAPEASKGAENQEVAAVKWTWAFGQGSIQDWKPTIPVNPKELEHCILISCGIRMIPADRRGHALTVHLPSFFGNQFEETRLTARKKINLRWEFVDTILKFKGLDTPQKRTRAALRTILAPCFNTTTMAPLDRVTIEDYCEKEASAVPKTWVLGEMGIMGFACWQGAMALLRDLNNEEMEILYPELSQIGQKWLNRLRKL